jgi:hypothetical protein
LPARTPDGRPAVHQVASLSLKPTVKEDLLQRETVFDISGGAQLFDQLDKVLLRSMMPRVVEDRPTHGLISLQSHPPSVAAACH